MFYCTSTQNVCFGRNLNAHVVNDDASYPLKRQLVLYMSMQPAGAANRLQGGFGRGLTNADVVNDDAAAARVALRGQVNGQLFLVERTVRRYTLRRDTFILRCAASFGRQPAQSDGLRRQKLSKAFCGHAHRKRRGALRLQLLSGTECTIV